MAHPHIDPHADKLRQDAADEQRQEQEEYEQGMGDMAQVEFDREWEAGRRPSDWGANKETAVHRYWEELGQIRGPF